MLWRRRQRPSVMLKPANLATSPSPWFVYPTRGSLQGILPSRGEHEGPDGLNPITLGQQEKLCFSSNSATAAETRGSESPSLFFAACSRKNAPFTRVSADLTHVFPTPMRLREQGWDLELPGASLGAKMIKSIGPSPNLM